MPMRPAFEQQMLTQLAGFRHQDKDALRQRLNHAFDTLAHDLAVPVSDAERLMMTFVTGFTQTIASAETILSDLEAANGKIKAEAMQAGIPPARLAASIYSDVVEDQTVGDHREQRHL
jgi:hypothetical protein